MKMVAFSVLASIVVSSAQPATPEKERESLTGSRWEQVSKTQNGRVVTEMVLTFGKERFTVASTVAASVGKTATISRSQSEYDFKLAEEKGQPALVVRLKKSAKDVIVPYQLKGDKLEFQGQSAEELGLGGEWTRAKEKEASKEKNKN